MFKASEWQLDLVQLLWNTTAYLGITHLTTDMCAINICSINNFFVHAYIVEICDQTVLMDVTLACEFLCMDSHLTIFVITNLPTIAVMPVDSQNTILSAIVKQRPPFVHTKFWWLFLLHNFAQCMIHTHLHLPAGPFSIKYLYDLQVQRKSYACCWYYNATLQFVHTGIIGSRLPVVSSRIFSPSKFTIYYWW